MILTKKTLESAQDAQARCNAHMIATVPGYCAERWADIEPQQDGTFEFYVDVRVLPALTPAEIDSLQE